MNSFGRDMRRNWTGFDVRFLRQDLCVENRLAVPFETNCAWISSPPATSTELLGRDHNLDGMIDVGDCRIWFAQYCRMAGNRWIGHQGVV